MTMHAEPVSSDVVTEMTLTELSAIFSGEDGPPTEEIVHDMLAPEADEDVAILIEAISDEPDGDVIVTTSPAPRVVKDRASAFADRVAGERAQEMLGDDFTEIVSGMSAAPKKVSEKVYNALCYLADRGKLSNFTSLALDQLSIGVTTTAELVAVFRDKGYSEATARSQAQQQMVALPILKLAERHKDRLALIDGPILKLFDEASMRVPGEKVEAAPKVSKPKKSKEPVLEDDADLLAEAEPTPEVEAIIEAAPVEPVVPVSDEDLLADLDAPLETEEPVSEEDLTELLELAPEPEFDDLTVSEDGTVAEAPEVASSKRQRNRAKR